MMMRQVLARAVRAPTGLSRAAYSASPVAADGSGRHGTTILCVRKEGKVVVIGDGQVSQGSMVVKPNAKKVRRMGDGVLVGFAGSTADAFTLLERLEERLEEHPGQLTRACVDLAKAWRTDKYLRRLEAVLLVADKDVSFELTGNGDVLEPKDGIMAVGSGGAYALAAARALADVPDMDPEDIAQKAMTIAADLCVYTNHNFTVEVLETDESRTSEPADVEK
uniref:ATP-dependent protease subunit HslV n=1 Tax=Rhizochromulina marina TaxID=1034831 RepID=A0A7S2WBX0_9STRA|mmetsp:Transcript_20677/g.60420  ORF Transcript_20677/g.60420 Transcript_20677/m.60420 type:complete len:222 (+) Transcript_20677:59-724(+)